MKKLFAAALFFMIIASSQISLSQSQKGYEITGHLEGLRDGEKVRMLMFSSIRPNDFVARDSAYVKNGQFHITGYVPEGPRMYWLTFERDSKLNHAICTLWINNDEHITINNTDSSQTRFTSISEHIVIEGSPTNHARDVSLDMERLYLQQKGAVKSHLADIKDSVGFDHALVEGLLRSQWILDDRLFTLFLSNNSFFVTTPAMKSFVPYLLYEIWGEGYGGQHQAFFKAAYDLFDEAQRNSFYGKKVKEIAASSEGQQFPDFTLPKVEGGNLSLHDVYTKSKLCIVHFWGTNSYLREERQQELQVMYKKYKDKGLSIVGIAADTSEWMLKGFVKSKQYPWVNVSDLKGWNNNGVNEGIIETVYHEGGHEVPNTTNVLIDTKGRIVAWGVDGVELQWYLWKYLGD